MSDIKTNNEKALANKPFSLFAKLIVWLLKYIIPFYQYYLFLSVYGMDIVTLQNIY
jgi:hypothetical protein